MLSIAKKLRKHKIQIYDGSENPIFVDAFFEAIHSDNIPDSILHHFACDCAERVLTKEYNNGRVPNGGFYSVLRIKRYWIEKRTGDQFLQSAIDWCQRQVKTAHRQSLQTVIDLSQSWQGLRKIEASRAVEAAAIVVLACAQPDAKLAAQTTANEAALHENHVVAGEELIEIAWQNNHLADLIEQYQQSRVDLLSTITKRANHLAFIIPSWQRETNDALYS